MGINNNRIVGIHNVTTKAGLLWFEVEKRLEAISKPKDRKEKILPHKLLMFLEKSRDEVGEKIEMQDVLILQASLNSLEEHDILKKVNAFSTDEDRERSTNNQLSWEYSFVLNYAIILAQNDIRKLNDCTDNPNGSTHKEIVNQLVNAIELMREYNKLIEDIENTKASKENEDLKKEMDTKDEDNKYYKILSRALENRLNEIQNQPQPEPEPITGFSCPYHPDTVKEIFDLLVNHLPKPQIKGELEDFQAIFSNTQTQVTGAVKWLIMHNRKPNKTALFTFIKLMLKLDELPREILRQANKLFVCGKENIFPENYSYPSLKEQRSSYFTHFKQIKQTYFPDFLKE